MKIRTSLLALAVLGFTATSSLAAPTKMMDTSLGSVLVDENGMTLYSFDKDEKDKSNCYDDCAVKWPPFLATDGDMAEGDYTIIDRTDGTKQWSYEGMPLYYWQNDNAPGDTTGDGVGGVWHVVK
jgi:predicted lipoprotein with Yx(FWY)xxD motif